MQKLIVVFGFIFLCGLPIQLKAQYAKQDTSYSKFFIGSTFFMLSNLVPDDNSPKFVQLNLGYRLGPKDALSLELKTWEYGWSLGIPYGDKYEAAEEKFPGKVSEYGFAFAYQHFWWKGLYSGIHVMNAFQTFKNDEGANIKKGFQIFNTYRLGYHFKFFKNKFFIEPSIAITHRPYHSKMPDDFKALDDKWPNYFIGEPGLHFGYNF